MFSKKEDPLVPFGRRMKIFFAVHWRGVAAFIVPIICLPIVLITPTQPFQWCAYCLAVMAAYWVTECIALPVTAFLPIVIFPLTGIMTSDRVASCYFNNTVFVFIGSLMLASAVEQSSLHKRIALGSIRLIGYSHYKLLFAMSFVTMMVSMWLTNTASTTMMVPINFALLRVFEEQKLLTLYEVTETGDEVATDMTTCYFCSATYAATVGGIGTLVGTGTNLAFKGLFESVYPAAPEIFTFPKFSAFTVPPMILTEITVYLWMIFKYFGFLRPGSKEAKRSVIPPEGLIAAKNAIAQKSSELGTITFWEIMVIILFGGSIVMFFSRSPQMFVGWGDLLVEYFGFGPKTIGDSVTAMLASCLMLYLPQHMRIFNNFTAKNYEDLEKSRVPGVILWRQTDKVLPYSFSFLLGGGFALSTAAGKDYTDLNGVIGRFLAGLKTLPNPVILLVIIIFTVFLTNFASNVAVANVVCPIAMSLAKEIQKNPISYNLGSGVAASYCFMLPVGTPGNLVVQSAAKIPTGKMIVAGSMPTVTCILILWVFLLIYSPLIWPEIKGELPEWTNN